MKSLWTLNLLSQWNNQSFLPQGTNEDGIYWWSSQVTSLHIVGKHHPEENFAKSIGKWCETFHGIIGVMKIHENSVTVVA